jgi:hypothetical protein
LNFYKFGNLLIFGQSHFDGIGLLLDFFNSVDFLFPLSPALVIIIGLSDYLIEECQKRLVLFFGLSLKILTFLLKFLTDLEKQGLGQLDMFDQKALFDDVFLQ